MVRSVNIFRTAKDSHFPIRLEFWDTDKLIEVYEVSVVTSTIALRISEFILAD